MSKGLVIEIKQKPTKFFIKLYGFLGYVPAKALVMNHIQFNGYFGCPYCFIEGNFLNLLITKLWLNYFITLLGSYSTKLKKMLFFNEPIQLHCNQTYIEDSYNGSPDEPSNGVKGMTLLGEHIILLYIYLKFDYNFLKLRQT